MSQSIQTHDPTLDEPQWVRLRTLIILRWLAIAGQLGAVAVATQVLMLDMRLDLCLLLIGLSALFNIGAAVIFPQTKRLTQRDATLSLLFDLGQLTALLYFTGGLTNPFAVLILAQTIISATVLTLGATILLAALSIVAIAFLAVFHVPLHNAAGEVLTMPPVLLIGSWAAMSISVVFFGTYTRRVALERFAMAEALTATQLALEREQKLTALGGVVAAAAHELGTPLATIKLTTAELLDDHAENPDLREDLELIRDQAERCRVILNSMGRSGKEDIHLRTAPLTAVIEEAAEPHMHRGKTVCMRVRGLPASPASGEDQPLISRRPEIIHGVRNLVQNAVDFARSTVWIDVDWTDSRVVLKVGDDGRGYPADLVGRIGDPFLRRRGSQSFRDVRRPGYQGMGLGLFIAKTLLERTGAKLTFANGVRSAAGAEDPSLAQPSGAIVEVAWTVDAVTVSRDKARSALGANLAVDGA